MTVLASWVRRLAPALLAPALVVACAGATARSVAPAHGSVEGSVATIVPAASTTPAVGSSVYVSVSVATLWVSSTSPRTVDAPALSSPAQPRHWLAAMSTELRRGLMGRVETQALLGERLLVTGVKGDWLHVVAVGQRTSRDPRGYPGWVPARQVTSRTPVSTAYAAVVVVPTTVLRSTANSATLEVSFATRLPIVATSSTQYVVEGPRGGRWSIDKSATRAPATARAAYAASRTSVLTVAKRMLGLPYLWGGRSGFALDCSGFTQLVYRLHGRTLPRDADEQARSGSAVALGHQQPADLLFFQHGSTVDHVGFFAGSGRMLHAPSAGKTVSYVALSSMTGLVAARSYLG